MSKNSLSVIRFTFLVQMSMMIFCFNMKVFYGNQDVNTVVSNKLKQPITARYIRFKPLLWNYRISMRVEIYGCLGIVQILYTVNGLNSRVTLESLFTNLEQTPLYNYRYPTNDLLTTLT